MFDYVWIYLTDRNPAQRKQKYSLLKSAMSGNVVAMGKLAKLSDASGDNETAVKWYKKIMEQGGRNRATAANNLGSIYYRKRNTKLAIDYFYQAANEGLTVAKKNMGIVYQELEEWKLAIEWFEIAAFEGDQVAKQRLERLRLRTQSSPVYSWQEAERLAQRWMFYFGFYDATLTTSGADGGIDVSSSQALAQVKFESTNTGRPVIQALAGEAHNQGKSALFFSLSGYTKGAISWAEESRIQVALFKYDRSGNMEGVNQAAKTIMNTAKRR